MVAMLMDVSVTPLSVAPLALPELHTFFSVPKSPDARSVPELEPELDPDDDDDDLLERPQPAATRDTAANAIIP
jgi:hypothetical protein